MIHTHSSAAATSSGECSNVNCPEIIVSSHPPSGAQVSFPTYVTLTASVAGATIRYTVDGTEPDMLSTAYTGPILVASAGTVIRAAAHL